jgi:aldehyde dehydrogenase (NAD+)
MSQTAAAPSKTATLKQFIGGKWVDGTGKGEIKDLNPANTDDVLAVGRAGSLEDAQKALAAAEKAFPAWKRTPAPARARYLDKLVKLARDRKEELARLMTREEGKIISEARGEMEKGINLLEWFAGEGLRFMGISAPSELPSNFLYTLREPLGVVSVITPWNFPWAIPCWKMAPALVAGNTIVFKPASLTPWLAVRFAELIQEAGLPDGVLNLVIGSGSQVGDPLVKDPRVKAVSFTGSNSIGQSVHSACGVRGAKVTCEMGGKNPCVVMDDADLDLALGGVMRGAFGSTGQRCTATSRLILQHGIADKFVGLVVEAAKKIKVGDGLDESIGMGPAVDEGQLKTDLDYIEQAQKSGAKLLTGGRRLTEGVLAKGFFVEPTVFDGVKRADTLYQEEVFGPVLAVHRVKDYEEAVAAANDCPFGLTSAIYTRDMTSCMRFVDDIEAGMVHINSPTIGGEAQVPFGGRKGSGVGEREMAKEGVYFFSEPKTVFVDYTGAVRKANIY